MSMNEITLQRIINENLAICNGSGLVAPIGFNEKGGIEYTDYSQIPNLLVCGTTGSGKTTFVRTLIASLAAIAKPTDVRFLIFDYRGNDYIEFSNLPHLLLPIGKDARMFTGVLSWAATEAVERTKKLSNPNIEHKFPDIFIVIDDYAEIAQLPETQETIYRLLQIGHRVKIHVVFVTSLALAKIISTELKVHIGHRITFFLPEKLNSRVVIDQNGAETLEMPGEFIAKFYSKTLKYRAIELSSAEIKKIYAQYGEPETCVDVIREIEISASQKAEGIDECLNDEILPKAIQIVIEAQSASTTLIQRRLKIGYSRAAHIIDVLEQRGIIGPYEGAKPRKVLISRQQWYEMNALANSELYP